MFSGNIQAEQSYNHASHGDVTGTQYEIIDKNGSS